MTELVPRHGRVRRRAASRERSRKPMRFYRGETTTCKEMLGKYSGTDVRQHSQHLAGGLGRRVPSRPRDACGSGYGGQGRRLNEENHGGGLADLRRCAGGAATLRLRRVGRRAFGARRVQRFLSAAKRAAPLAAW